MKKVFIIVLALLVIKVVSQAQSVGIGLRAGLNISNINYSSSSATGSISNASNIGFQGGIVSQFGIGKFFSIAPEVIFSQQGSKVDYDFGTPSSNASVKYTLNYVNVPVLARFTLKAKIVKVFVNTGPQLGIFTSSSYSSNNSNFTFEDSSVNKADFGWVFGGGVGVKLGLISWLFIDARYTLGLTNINKSVSTGEPDSKNGVTGISIGYMFVFGK